MPRRNRPNPRNRDTPPLRGGIGDAGVESHPDGDWLVRRVTGAQATKVYRCPGCDHEIHPGIPHIVAWPADDHGTISDRRHWHTSCWTARNRRGPTPKRW